MAKLKLKKTRMNKKRNQGGQGLCSVTANENKILIITIQAAKHLSCLLMFCCASLCVCMCVYVCVYACVYVCVATCVCKVRSQSICMCVYVHVHTKL